MRETARLDVAGSIPVRPHLLGAGLVPHNTAECAGKTHDMAAKQ